MTYAVMISKGSKNWKPVQNGGVAVGEESSFIHDEYKRTAEHYLLPVSRQWTNPLTRFFMLKAEWETETVHLSSMTKIVMHHAYQQIIGMGQIAIPSILSEMGKNRIIGSGL